jgi:hypothetical protein
MPTFVVVRCDDSLTHHYPTWQPGQAENAAEGGAGGRPAGRRGRITPRGGPGRTLVFEGVVIALRREPVLRLQDGITRYR